MTFLYFTVLLALIYWPASLAVCFGSVCLQGWLAHKWLRGKRTALASVATSATIQMLIPFVAIGIVNNIRLTETREQFSLPPEVIKVFSFALIAEAILFVLSALCLISNRSKRGSSQPATAPYSEPAARSPQG